MRERCGHTNATLSPDSAAPAIALAGPPWYLQVCFGVRPRCSPLEVDLDFKSKQAWGPLAL